MSDRNASNNSERQKRSRFAAPSYPSEETVKQTHGSPIPADRNHVTSHAGTLHDKLEKIVVHCVTNFMTRRQNLHYKIASQHKLKSDAKYIPKSAQIKLELSIEKGTKEGKAFYSSKRSTRKYSLIVSYNSSPSSLRQGNSTWSRKRILPLYPLWSRSTASPRDS